MPARPHLVGFKQRLLVATLAPDTFVETTCQACGHVARIAPWHLHARFPPEAKLVDVDRWWRCKACRALGKMHWSIWQAYPRVAFAPPPGQIELTRQERAERFRERWQRDEEDGGAA